MTSGLPDKAVEEERIITLPEASKIIGCSRSTVWRMARDGQIDAFRVRNAWLTSTAACRKFLEERRYEQVVECRMKSKR